MGFPSNMHLLCDSTHLLEHAVRLHPLTGVIRWLVPCAASRRRSWAARGLIRADRVTMLLEVAGGVPTRKRRSRGAGGLHTRLVSSRPRSLRASS